jgi:hypothetical protein
MVQEASKKRTNAKEVINSSTVSKLGASLIGGTACIDYGGRGVQVVCGVIRVVQIVSATHRRVAHKPRRVVCWY